MRFTLLAVCLATLLVGVSSATASPPAGKGKPGSTTETRTTGKKPETACKLAAIVLKGTLTDEPADGALSMSVDVASGNRWAKPYLGPQFITLDASTKVRRQGLKKVGDLVRGDRVVVHARACRPTAGATTLAALTALRVIAHPAIPGKATTTAPAPPAA